MDKVSNSYKKELDCEHAYNKKNFKTKVRSYGDDAADFHAEKKYLKQYTTIFAGQ